MDLVQLLKNKLYPNMLAVSITNWYYIFIDFTMSDFKFTILLWEKLISMPSI